jgi:DNA polymerase
MSLNLDRRQRAMLEEMRIPFWWPQSAQAALPDTPVAEPLQASVAVPEPAAPPEPRKAIAPSTPAAAAPAADPTRRDPVSRSGSEWVFQTPHGLYGSVIQPGGWGVITEAVWPGDDALADSSGRLLDNMLRAMKLHQGASVWVAGLARRADEPALLDAGHWLQAHAPGMLLLMGRIAAREVLQTDEPLGRLRGRVHSVRGIPAVVTYDAPYLLRSQADKARAWADLCLALAHRANPV